MSDLPRLHLASLRAPQHWGPANERGHRWVVAAMASPTKFARRLTAGRCDFHAPLRDLRGMMAALRSGDAERLARAQTRYEVPCRDTARQQLRDGWLYPDARWRGPDAEPAPAAAPGRGFGRVALDGARLEACAMLEAWDPEQSCLELQPESTLVCHCMPPGRRPAGQDFCHLEIWAPYLAWAGWEVELYGRTLVRGEEGAVWADTGDAYAFRWVPAPCRQLGLV